MQRCEVLSTVRFVDDPIAKAMVVMWVILLASAAAGAGASEYLDSLSMVGLKPMVKCPIKPSGGLRSVQAPRTERERAAGGATGYVEATITFSLAGDADNGDDDVSYQLAWVDFVGSVHTCKCVVLNCWSIHRPC